MQWLRNEYVIFALTALTIFTFYMAMVALTRKDPLKERLKKVLPPDVPGVGFGYEEARSPMMIFCSNVLAAFGVDIAKIKRDLYLPMARAGLGNGDAVVYFIFFRRFIQPLLLFCSVLVFFQLSTHMRAPTAEKLMYLIGGFILFVAGLYGSNLFLRNRTDKRKVVLQRSFADALDLLLVCVESGLPLDSALARVCRELKKAHPAITAELDRTRIELNVLNDRIQALTNLSERTDTPGFRSLTSSLIQSEKFGTSIADTLRGLSDEYRTTRMLYAENKAARIPALITVPLIFFIMPAFMLIIMGPPIIKIKQGGGMFPTKQTSR
jgi:tight adherence protein C